eukprot:6455665-Amphidinium_carterae.1
MHGPNSTIAQKRLLQGMVVCNPIQHSTKAGMDKGFQNLKVVCTFVFSGTRLCSGPATIRQSFIS